MNASKKAFCLAAVLLALAMLLACLSWLPMGSGNGMPAAAETGAAQATAENVSADADVPAAVASYDFTSTSFDSAGWTEVEVGAGSVTLAPGTGLTISSGLRDNRAGYAVQNPLKGSAGSGFSVMITGSVTDMVNDFESFFGFTESADPLTVIYKSFYVHGTGTRMRLNVNGEGNGGNNFYDITQPNAPSLVAPALSMTQTSQYILTVDASAITVYLNGAQAAKYDWNSTWDGHSYCYDTVGFVNEADYFNLGIAGCDWGNAGMTIQGAALYASALTAEEIAAINASYADFSELNPLIEQGEAIRANNYDLSTGEGAAAYAAFDSAFASARALSFLTATQQQVDDAAAALQAALNGLQAHYRTPDLTDSLAAAYPLTENGSDLTDASNTANRVLYMNGTATSELTSGFFVRRQGRAAAKLFTDDMLNRGEMTTDPDAPSSTGLKIPSAAFAGVTADTGMTLTVSVLAESWSAEYQWSRILQLGTKNPSGDGASGAQFFYALQSIYTRANITTPGTGGLNWVADNVGIPTLGEWITVSLSFEPNQHTIYLYVSSFSTSQWSGGMAMTEYTVSAAEYETIIDAILNGQDNWIGRSYWATDDNLIGYASNLSVYGRALTTDEVTQLHSAKDLSAFVE